MIYVFAIYALMGLITSLTVYLVEEDEWEEGELFILIPAFFFWPVPLLYILGFAATRPIVHLRKRIHRKKETLPIEDMSLHGRLPKPPRAGTLWEEEHKDRSCG